MSVRVMSMVFERYPSGGGEMLLALALADHAHDDGQHIRPSVKLLAEKTRQSERAVQYQLRKMECAGWLILVNAGHGGRNRRREYRINPAWIKGEKIAPITELKGANSAPFEMAELADEKGENSAPFEVEKGAIDDTKGCKSEHERVQSATEKGAKLLHPHRTIREPSVEPSIKPSLLRESDYQDSARAERTESPPDEPKKTASESPVLIGAVGVNTTPPNPSFRMFADWSPRDHFGQMLILAGLPGSYDWEPDWREFVLYWSHVANCPALNQSQWESKLRTAVIANNVRNASKPTPLPVDWEPSPACWQQLIDAGYAPAALRDALPRFALYWRDDGGAQRSWNTKFTEWVHRNVAHPDQPEPTHATRERPPAKPVIDHDDTSWADSLDIPVGGGG
jgi:hypothetical protein